MDTACWRRCHASIKSRQTSPTGDERQNKRKSGPSRPTASKRVSSPPGRDHLHRVGRHRPPNRNSKPRSGSVAGRSARSVGKHRCVKDRAAILEASDVTIRSAPRHSRRAGADSAREVHRQAADADVPPLRRAARQLEGGVPRRSSQHTWSETKGRARTTPVGGFPDGEDSWLVAATLGGAARHPSWFLNMAKHPDDIWLEVGTERFKVRGESLEGQERAQSLARLAKIAPRYGKYQREDRSRDSYRAADPRAMSERRRARRPAAALA